MGKGVLIIGFAWMSGCVAEGSPEHEQGIEMPLIGSQTHFETFIISLPASEHERLIAPVVVPEPDNDPCQCKDAECRKDWVEANLGCNVCIALNCENQDSVHVCATCPD